MTQHDIARVQELLDERVDHLAQIEVKRGSNQPFAEHFIALKECMNELYELTNEPKYLVK